MSSEQVIAAAAVPQVVFALCLFIVVAIQASISKKQSKIAEDQNKLFILKHQFDLMLQLFLAMREERIEPSETEAFIHKHIEWSRAMMEVMGIEVPDNSDAAS